MRRIEYEVPDLTNLGGMPIDVIAKHRDSIAKEINRMESNLRHLWNQKELLNNMIELKDACASMQEEIKELERT